MRPIHVKGDVEKEGIHHIPKCGEVVVGRLASEGQKSRCPSGKDCGDFFQHHVGGGENRVVLGAKRRVAQSAALKKSSRYEEEHHGGDKIYLLDL